MIAIPYSVYPSSGVYLPEKIQWQQYISGLIIYTRINGDYNHDSLGENIYLIM